MTQFIRLDNEIIRKRAHGIEHLDDVGLFALLSLFLSIPDFQTPVGGLSAAIAKHCSNGRHSLLAARARLCAAGYLKRVRMPDESFRLRDVYTLHAHPEISTPAVSCLSLAAARTFPLPSRAYLPPTVNYTPVSVAVLMDARLSLSAKALYALIRQRLLLSDRVRGVALNREGLRRSSGLGECAFRRIWRELKATGYLSLTHKYDAEQRHMVYEYHLAETARLTPRDEADKPAVPSPGTPAEPTVGTRVTPLAQTHTSPPAATSVVPLMGKGSGSVTGEKDVPLTGEEDGSVAEEKGVPLVRKEAGSVTGEKKVSVTGKKRVPLTGEEDDSAAEEKGVPLVRKEAGSVTGEKKVSVTGKKRAPLTGEEDGSAAGKEGNALAQTPAAAWSDVDTASPDTLRQKRNALPNASLRSWMDALIDGTYRPRTEELSPEDTHPAAERDCPDLPDRATSPDHTTVPTPSERRAIPPEDVRDITAMVKEQIEYPVLQARDNPLPLLDCTVELIATAMQTPSRATFTIRGAVYPAATVRSALTALDANEAEFAIQAVKRALDAGERNGKPIRHLRGYLLSCLFTAKTDFAASLLY